MDSRGVGHFGSQPQGEVLLHNPERPKAAGRRCGALAEINPGDRPCSGYAGRRRSLMEALNRVRSFFQRQSRDTELNAELAAHLELAVEENMARGMSPDEARRRALISFGGVAQAKEQHSEARGLPWLDVLLQDLRFSFRTLARDRGFTV